MQHSMWCVPSRDGRAPFRLGGYGRHPLYVNLLQNIRMNLMCGPLPTFQEMVERPLDGGDVDVEGLASVVVGGVDGSGYG